MRGGCDGTVQLAGAIKGVEVKVLIQRGTQLERVIVWLSSGLAVARGAGFKSLSPFHPPCSIFPGDADGAGKYICSCMLGARGLSLSSSPLLLHPPAVKESRKATEHTVMWAMGGLFPGLRVAQTVSEWASNALEKHMHFLFNENLDWQGM